MLDAQEVVKSEQADRWLLLIHQLPAKPAYLRVKVWRRLQALGAVPVKNAVHALPASDQSQEDFEWVLKEILEAGGEAVICEARFVDGLSDSDIRGLFNAARDSEYAEIANEARTLSAHVEQATASGARIELRPQLTRLKSRHAQCVAVDYFDANGRQAADGLIRGLDKALSEELSETSREETKAKVIGNLKGRVWVTRTGVHVDRIACAWLIRRFIDETARFKFVPPKGYIPADNELRFDMFDAEITHEGDSCSFEVLLARAGLKDLALQAIAEIVHDIDLNDGKFGTEEAPGVKALINGLCSGTRDDAERIARGSAIFDNLYASFQRKRALRAAHK
jgi:hypothetical protein